MYCENLERVVSFLFADDLYVLVLNGLAETFNVDEQATCNHTLTYLIVLFILECVFLISTVFKVFYWLFCLCSQRMTGKITMKKDGVDE